MTKRCPKGMKFINGKCVPSRLINFEGKSITISKKDLAKIKEVDKYTTHVAKQFLACGDTAALADSDYFGREDLHEHMLEELQIDRDDKYYDPVMSIVVEIIEDKIKLWTR